MITKIERNRKGLFHRFFSYCLCMVFAFSFIVPQGFSYAQAGETVLNLPEPGTMVEPSEAYSPTKIIGIHIDPNDALKFDFIVDTGDDNLKGEALKRETEKLIKYFLASLTIPEEDLWVNLAPYEEGDVIPTDFGYTEMGRDLLAEDYMLKQLTSSLMHPEKKLGAEFWNRVYARAMDLYGTTNIPLNTFNKIWIVPDDALVYETGQNAFVVKSHLKVMLEEDYLLLKENLGKKKFGTDKLPEKQVAKINEVSSKVVKEVLLPEIEKEVNTGKNFATLRQVYNSMILATWYKQALRDSLLGKIYVDKGKTAGVEVADKEIKDKIFQQYLEAFERGAYKIIRDEYDPATNMVVTKKYFSGGFTAERINQKVSSSKISAVLPVLPKVKEQQLTQTLVNTPGLRLSSKEAKIIASTIKQLPQSAYRNEAVLMQTILPQLSKKGVSPELVTQLRRPESGMRSLFTKAIKTVAANTANKLSPQQRFESLPPEVRKTVASMAEVWKKAAMNRKIFTVSSSLAEKTPVVSSPTTPTGIGTTLQETQHAIVSSLLTSPIPKIKENLKQQGYTSQERGVLSSLVYNLRQIPEIENKSIENVSQLLSIARKAGLSTEEVGALELLANNPEFAKFSLGERVSNINRVAGRALSQRPEILAEVVKRENINIPQSKLAQVIDLFKTPKVRFDLEEGRIPQVTTALQQKGLGEVANIFTNPSVISTIAERQEGGKEVVTEFNRAISVGLSAQKGKVFQQIAKQAGISNIERIIANNPRVQTAIELGDISQLRSAVKNIKAPEAAKLSQLLNNINFLTNLAKAGQQERVATTYENLSRYIAKAAPEEVGAALERTSVVSPEQRALAVEAVKQIQYNPVSVDLLKKEGNLAAAMNVAGLSPQHKVALMNVFNPQVAAELAKAVTSTGRKVNSAANQVKVLNKKAAELFLTTPQSNLLGLLKRMGLSEAEINARLPQIQSAQQDVLNKIKEAGISPIEFAREKGMEGIISMTTPQQAETLQKVFLNRTGSREYIAREGAIPEVMTPVKNFVGNAFLSLHPNELSGVFEQAGIPPEEARRLAYGLGFARGNRLAVKNALQNMDFSVLEREGFGELRRIFSSENRELPKVLVSLSKEGANIALKELNMGAGRALTGVSPEFIQRKIEKAGVEKQTAKEIGVWLRKIKQLHPSFSKSLRTEGISSLLKMAKTEKEKSYVSTLMSLPVMESLAKSELGQSYAPIKQPITSLHRELFVNLATQSPEMIGTQLQRTGEFTQSEIEQAIGAVKMYQARVKEVAQQKNLPVAAVAAESGPSVISELPVQERFALSKFVSPTSGYMQKVMVTQQPVTSFQTIVAREVANMPVEQTGRILSKVTGISTEKAVEAINKVVLSREGKRQLSEGNITPLLKQSELGKLFTKPETVAALALAMKQQEFVQASQKVSSAAAKVALELPPQRLAKVIISYANQLGLSKSETNNLASKLTEQILNFRANPETVKEMKLSGFEAAINSSPIELRPHMMALVPELARRARVETGGIDLSASMLDLKIKRDGNGVPLKLSDQPIDQLKLSIGGFAPIIEGVRPANNIPELLGVPAGV